MMASSPKEKKGLYKPDQCLQVLQVPTLFALNFPTSTHYRRIIDPYRIGSVRKAECKQFLLYAIDGIGCGLAIRIIDAVELKHDGNT